MKCLVGILFLGVFIFIFKLWFGNVFDKEFIKKCGILDFLEVGDDIMVDCGFIIWDYCIERGCILNIFFFLKGKLLLSK